MDIKTIFDYIRTVPNMVFESGKPTKAKYGTVFNVSNKTKPEEERKFKRFTKRKPDPCKKCGPITHFTNQHDKKILGELESGLLASDTAFITSTTEKGITIIDSGASAHVWSEKSEVENFRKVKNISLFGLGGTTNVICVGVVPISVTNNKRDRSFRITLRNVRIVPTIGMNLISPKCLKKNNNYDIWTKTEEDFAVLAKDSRPLCLIIIIPYFKYT
ncbi:hypothetical protein V1514DRAFT_329760 [Lipomyces japonicus]|uniref:uncharacterized protein n=1 Tax=Lipomyces japonicus TaxID=56871 RepID=UPI0034CE7224